MDSITKVVYINLAERIDRKTQIQRELLPVFPAAKIQRFNAIRDSRHGGIGCTMSHIAVLNMARQEKWPSVLIVEDDLVLTNKEEGLPVLEKLLLNPYDVICLGGTYISYDPQTYRLNTSQTATAYIVAQHYYDTLIANFEESLAGFQHTGIYSTYALDQWWKRLQPTGLWYIVRPNMATQRPGYSDIEKHHVDYTSGFR